MESRKRKVPIHDILKSPSLQADGVLVSVLQALIVFCSLFFDIGSRPGAAKPTDLPEPLLNHAWSIYLTLGRCRTRFFLIKQTQSDIDKS